MKQLLIHPLHLWQRIIEWAGLPSTDAGKDADRLVSSTAYSFPPVEASRADFLD